MSAVYKWVVDDDGIIRVGGEPTDPVRLIGVDPASNRVAAWVEHAHPELIPPYSQPVRQLVLLPTGIKTDRYGPWVGSVIAGVLVWHVHEAAQ